MEHLAAICLTTAVIEAHYGDRQTDHMRWLLKDFFFILVSFYCHFTWLKFHFMTITFHNATPTHFILFHFIEVHYGDRHEMTFKGRIYLWLSNPLTKNQTKLHGAMYCSFKIIIFFIQKSEIIEQNIPFFKDSTHFLV